MKKPFFVGSDNYLRAKMEYGKLIFDISFTTMLFLSIAPHPQLIAHSLATHFPSTSTNDC